MKYLVYTPFTGLGLKNGFRGQTWLDNRIKVFKNFTLTSMLHQSDRDFILWVSWRPEEKDNPAVRELWSLLSRIRDLSFIFTYNGLCFEDDKYDRPESLDRLESNLRLTVAELEEVLGDDDTIFMHTWPSDDMYLSTAVEDIKKKIDKLDVNQPQSVGFMNGYIMNMNTMQIAEYTNETIPPFFGVLFPRAVFMDAKSHIKWTGPYRSHEYIADHTEYHNMDYPGFIVGTHGENISTTWNHRYIGDSLTGRKRDMVLLQAGLDNTEPIVLEKDVKRKATNKMLKILPKPLRRWYIKQVSPDVGSAINGYNRFEL